MKNAVRPSQVHTASEEHYFNGYFNAAQSLGDSVLHQLSRKQQHDVILKALRAGPKLTDQLRAYGCFMANSRIHELRKLGYSISTELVHVVGIDGRLRKMALYRLHEPTAAELAHVPEAIDGPDCEDYQAWADTRALDRVIAADRAAHEGGA